MTYEGLYRWGREELLSAEITEAQLDARLLLESVCGTGRNDLLVHGDREVDSEKQNAYERLIWQKSEDSSAAADRGTGVHGAGVPGG